MALDANQNPVAYPDATPSNITTAAWTYQVGSYTVPAGVSYVLLYGEIYLPTGATVARFDDGFLTFGSYAGATPTYYVEDLLGSSSVLTDSSGVVCYDADFYPYGGERTVTNSCAQNVYKFEGKERDAETGNDDFGARYYSNRFGRWLSADWSSVPVPVPYANLTNPQTLNLYSMVADDPESFADLDGHLQQSPANSPCSSENQQTCNNQQQQQTQAALSQDVQKEAKIGVMKELVNTGVDLLNLASAFLLGDATAGLGTPNPPQIPELQASNDAQQVGMVTTAVALVAIPGTGETKAPEAIKLAKALASEAQIAEKGIVIAGAGDKDGVVLKKATELAKNYGGKAEDWSKKTSTAYNAADGSKISTHWYEVAGSAIKYELKTIIDSAPWKGKI